MKKVIIAINNKNIIKKIKQENNLKIIYDNLQYREAILEILEKIKNIDIIFISENIPGVISVEDLVKEIKKINNKIDIIFFLKEQNIEKENYLKKLGIKKIYLENKKIEINKKNKIKKYINRKIKNNELKKIENKNKINNKLKTIKNKINNKFKIIKNKLNKNNIIIIEGNKKSGKTTITNLLTIKLLKNNKKILIININNFLEKNYLRILKKIKYKKINDLINKKIKINNNLYFSFFTIGSIRKINIEKILKENIKKFDYILVDMGIKNKNRKLKQLLKICDKRVVVIEGEKLGIKEIEKLKEKNSSIDEKEKCSLHIVNNKYYFSSFSILLFKEIFKSIASVEKIFWNKKYKNLESYILKNEKFKLDIFIKYNLNKIIN